MATAQALLDGTVEGTKPDQYEAGSKAAFKTVSGCRKCSFSRCKRLQAAVTNACAQLLAAIATYQGNLIAEIAAANLIGYWKMNGNANDSSGNGNNGVVTAGHAYFGAGTPARLLLIVSDVQAWLIILIMVEI